MSSTATPIPSRPAEAKKDDSGIVDLNLVRETATAEQKAAAEKAKPATADLLDDDDAPASEQAVSEAKPQTASGGAKKGGAATAPATKRSYTNAYIGAAVGIAGLAAAFAMVMQSRGTAPHDTTQVVAETRLEAPADGEPAAQADETSPTPREDTGGLALDEIEGDSTDDEAEAAGKPVVGGPLPAGKKSAEGEPAEAEGKGDEVATTDQPLPGKPKSDGDLASEIEKAAGAEGAAPDQGEPAAADPKGKNQNIPAKPSQGSVQAAIGSVMGGAKACVAAADDVSRATITFSSGGSVQSVSVSGWAAGKGAAGCIKAALQGANVGPFSESSYTVGMTIRP